MRAALVALALSAALAGGCRAPGDVTADAAMGEVKACAPYQALRRERAAAGHPTRVLLEDFKDGWWRILVADDRDDRVIRLARYRVQRSSGRIERETDAGWIAVER